MAIGQSNAGSDTSCKCKQFPILDTGMYLNGMPPIDLQRHSTLHRALNFALNCECIARAHTPKYRSHSALSPSSAAESPLHTTLPRSRMRWRSARPSRRSTYLSMTRMVWPAARSWARQDQISSRMRGQALGGFVQDEQARVGDQGAAYGQHLLFTARQLVAHVGGALAQAGNRANTRSGVQGSAAPDCPNCDGPQRPSGARAP